MPPELVDFGRHGGKTYALLVAVLIAATTHKNIRAKSARTGEPGIRLRGGRGGDATWEHEHRDDTRADDSECYFLYAGNDDVESRLGHRDDRKSKERHGVASQHEHVAARRAVNQRKIQTNTDPQRDTE